MTSLGQHNGVSATHPTTTSRHPAHLWAAGTV